MFHGKTHYKWWFSIVMLNYQRVYVHTSGIKTSSMSKAQSAEFWVSTSVFVAAKVNWGLGLHWRPRMLDTKFPLSTWNHGMDSWCYLRIVPTSTHQFPIKKKTTEIVLQELVRNMVLPSYPYLSSAPWELNSTPWGLGLGTTLQNPQQPNSATVLNLS